MYERITSLFACVGVLRLSKSSSFFVYVTCGDRLSLFKSHHSDAKLCKFRFVIRSSDVDSFYWTRCHVSGFSLMFASSVRYHFDHRYSSFCYNAPFIRLRRHSSRSLSIALLTVRVSAVPDSYDYFLNLC